MDVRTALTRTTNASRRVGTGLLENRGLDHAAAMAFYVFFSLFPLLTFVGFALSRATLSGGLEPLLTRLYGWMPRGAVPFIANEVTRMATGDVTLAPASLLGFLYLTSSGAHNAMDLLEQMTQAPPRGWLRQRAVALMFTGGLVVATGLVAWLALKLVPETGSLSEVLLTGFHLSLDRATALVILAVLSVTAVAALALFYRVAVAQPSDSVRPVWPGAILAVTLFGLVTWGFGVWVRTLGRYSVYYGGLAAVAVLLMWLYLGSLALLAGAEANAQLAAKRSRYARAHGRH